MKLIITFLIVMAFIVGSPLIVLSQNAEQLYQKGLMQEEGEGNLQEAINIYNSIAQNENADISIRAKALLHVGLCYEKMGKEEATKAYQKLVNNFPGQKNEVAIARERLSRLILMAEKVTPEEKTKDFVIRKVLSSAPSEPLGAPSPDGRYISFVDWSFNSNLSILDLETKKRQNLTDFKDPQEQAYYSSWSPDGKKIAYFWWDKNGYNISIVDLKESQSKDLLKSKNIDWIELGNWSSDGKYVVATLSLSKKPESQIVRISTTDGSLQILKKYEDSYLGGKPWFSPDGRYIAYDLPDNKASGNSDIHILSVDNKTDNPLFIHPAHDYFLGWTPDENNILFASDRTGKVDAMIIPVEEGRATGQPKLVQSNIGLIVPMGFTNRGSYFYGDWPGEQDVYIAEINFITGEVVAKPTLAVRQFEGRNGSPYYSNDGKFLAYISRRGILRKGKPGTMLCIRELKTGTEIEINPPFDISNSISHPTWSPDDKSIALMFRIKNGRQVIYNYNIQTKEFTPLVTDKIGQVSDADYVYPQWSKDGKTIYYFELSQSNQTSFIKARNIETGNDSALFQYSSDDFVDRIFTIALSPDGKWISAINRGENQILRLISTESEEVRDLYNFNITGESSSIHTWSNDGKFIIYAYYQGDGRKWDLKRIAVEDGKAMNIEMNMAGINSPNLHPDGRHLAFSSMGYSRPEITIWTMENFLNSSDLETSEVKKTVEPKFTKIKIPTRLSWAVKLSPDGKKLAHVSDKKLWITPLSGNLGLDIPGAPVQLNTNGIEVEWTGLDWSSDGKWIAFNDYPKHDDNGEYIRNQRIFIVPSSGGTPKKIIENYRDVRVVNYRISLSHDAKKLAFTSVEENKQHIFSTSIDNIVPSQLVEMEAREPVFSPNGKYVAFVKDKNRGIGEGDLGLWVVKAEGGTPNKLADAGKASSPVWSPDGKMIAYLDYSVGNQINIVPFSITENNNKKVVSIEAPTGTEEVRLLAGWTPDNKIGALITSKQEFGLYTLPAKGGQAAKILQDSYALQPRWSGNGEEIYYVATPEEGDNRSYRRFLASVSADGGTGKPLQTNINGKSVKQFAFQSGNRVSPDGKWIVTSTWIPKKDTNSVNVHWPTSKIWKVSVDGEDAVQITNTPGNFSDMSPCWSPDGKNVAFVRFQMEKGKDDIFGGAPKIYSINSSGGEPELLVSISGKYVNSVIWSPDGRTIAYLTKEINQPHTKNLNLYDLETKESRIVGNIEAANVNNEMAWSPDSKRIAFNDAEGKVIKIITLSDERIEEISTGLVDANIYHLDWSPDGRRFVFCGWKGGEAEFWFLEDFLPLEKLSQNNEAEAAKEPEGIRIRQISKKPFLDDFGTVSRDGRYLSFVDWEDGELAILDLNTGEKRILTKNVTMDEDPEKFVIGSAISKNGKKVAYSWWRPNHTFDLHIFDIEKNSDKLLYKEDKVEAYPVAWRTDNEIIVIRRDINKELTQVTLFNVLDGTFQELKTGWPGLCVSPDGNFLAYSTKKSGQSNSDIYLLTIDKKVEVPLIVHPAIDKVIGWIPHTTEFLFISDRSGTWDLWSIQIINGKPSGEPRRLFSEIGEVEPVGITEKGECFIGFRKRNFNAYILSVNKLTGQPEGNPEIPLSGSIYSKNWSPDGKYMVRAQEGRHSFDLILREEQTGIEKRLAKELMYAIGPYWTSDAQSVYFYGMDQKMLQNKGYKGGIYKVDINSDNLEQKLLISDYEYTPSEDDALPISGHVVSDDQQYIYMLFQNDWIVKHDLNNGKDTILYRHPKFVRGVLQLSPDGNKLLFAIKNKGEKMSRLLTISTQGGDEKELCTSQESNISESAFWSPDGKYVYFSEIPEGTNLWRVDANGGTPEKVWKTNKRAESFVMHPSGEKISYSVRERITEVRMIEGLVNELNKIYSQNE